jgi:hypothetical protein
VERRTTDGFAQGRAVISPLDPTSDDTLGISFQNENLIALRNGHCVAIVPDLICVVDEETAEPITTEGLRYGQRVRVLGISTPDMMRTQEALQAFGPTAFGLTEPFVPVEGTLRTARLKRHCSCSCVSFGLFLTVLGLLQRMAQQRPRREARKPTVVRSTRGNRLA